MWQWEYIISILEIVIQQGINNKQHISSHLSKKYQLQIHLFETWKKGGLIWVPQFMSALHGTDTT